MPHGQPHVTRELLDATAEAIARWGLSEVNLERIADQSGMSRATIYRRGVTRDALIEALTLEVADTYSREMLPALARPGNARERLRFALEALCDVADGHLHLLAGMFLAQGEIFHQPGPDALVVDVFAEPFERLLRDGAADGSLRDLSPSTTATVIFNLVGWGYIHLRAAHHWQPAVTRAAIVDLVLGGLLSSGPSAREDV